MDLDQSTLIELVQKFPQLWDKSHKLFRDTIAVENAWRSISEILQCEVENCKSEWNSVRTRFIKERKIVKNLPSGTGQYNVKWPYYSLCLFLDKAISTRKTKSSYRPHVTLNKPTQELWETNLIETEGTDVVFEDQGSDCEKENTPNITATPGPSTSDFSNTFEAEKSSFRATDVSVSSTPKTTGKNQSKKRKNDIPLESLVDTCNTLGKQICGILQPNAEDNENEDILFGMSVGKFLASKPNTRIKTIAKAKIWEVLANVEDWN